MCLCLAIDDGRREGFIALTGIVIALTGIVIALTGIVTAALTQWYNVSVSALFSVGNHYCFLMK